MPPQTPRRGFPLASHVLCCVQIPRQTEIQYCYRDLATHCCTVSTSRLDWPPAEKRHEAFTSSGSPWPAPGPPWLVSTLPEGSPPCWRSLRSVGCLTDAVVDKDPAAEPGVPHARPAWARTQPQRYHWRTGRRRRPSAPDPRHRSAGSGSLAFPVTLYCTRGRGDRRTRCVP
eukprot:scaffold1388_cov390-Prasinococcus_capsulatus_cf.AAC.34